jgi:hypothetical protein
MGEKQRSISIWFFIGVLLAIYGALILGAGIHTWRHPPEDPASALHRFSAAGIWWGLLLLAAGGLWAVRFRPGRKAGADDAEDAEVPETPNAPEAASRE